MTVCVVGLTDVSLALATHYASRGLHTVVSSPDAAGVDAFLDGTLPLRHATTLRERVEELRKRGLLEVVKSVEDALCGQQVVVLFEPVRWRAGALDHSGLDAAAEQIGRALEPGALVVVESLVGIGDTRGRIQRALGGDALLAYSVQHCGTADVFTDLSRAPRVFAGIDERSQERASQFYLAVADSALAPASDVESAEAVALVQLAVRGVNSALSHEWGAVADSAGLDLDHVLTVASTQSLFPLAEPVFGAGGADVLLAMRLLAEQEGQGLVTCALAAHERALDLALDQFGRALEGLRGREIAVVAGPECRDVLPEIVGRLERAGAHPSVLTGTLPEVADGLVVLDVLFRLSGLPESLRSSCRAILDAVGVSNPRRVEGLGMAYIGVGRSSARLR